MTPEPTRPAFSFAPPAEWEHFTYTGDTLALLGHGGYMWAVSDGGLVRWSPDGSYIKYTTAEGLPYSRLRTLAFDEGGGLWLGGGYYSGLARITFDADGSIAAVEDFSSMGGEDHDVWFFLQTGDALYMAEYGAKISAWDGTTWAPALPSPPEELGDYIYTMAEIDGEIWAGMEEGLAIWDGESWREANLPGVEMGTEVGVICQDGDGVVWVGAYENLVRYFPDTGKWENMTDWWSGDYEITAALQASDGAFWLSGDGYTTIRASGSDSWQEVEAVSDWIRGPVAEDEQGNIWLALGGALSMYDGSRWQTFAVSNEPIENDLTHVVLTDSGQLWFTIEFGEQIISYDPETGEWSTVTEVNSTIQDIAIDEDGVVWLGTWDGLVRMEGATQRRFSAQDGLANEDVEVVLVDPKHPSVIWAGTETGLSRFDYAAGEWTTFDMAATGLSSDEIAALYGDSQGRVWAASAGEFSWSDDEESILAGLAVYDEEDESWTVVGEGGAPFDQYTTSVYDLIEDQDGNLWVAGRVSSLYRWDGEQWRGFTEADGASGESVLAMQPMPDGSIWFAPEDASLYRFDPQRGWSRIPPRDLGWSADAHEMLLSPDGVLWLLTGEGVISFRP
jgi:ligand-binding sensor domain-containing protein